MQLCVGLECVSVRVPFVSVILTPTFSQLGFYLTLSHSMLAALVLLDVESPIEKMQCHAGENLEYASEPEPPCIK